MNFNQICKLFLKHANPQIEITNDNSITLTSVNEARDILYYYLKKTYSDDPMILKRIGNRYAFKLIEHKTTRYDDKFTFVINMKATERSQFGKPNMFDEVKDIEYKTPQNAMDSIVKNPNYVYRGMCFEEFENIKSSGYIQSMGGYNLGDDQKDLTFFGEDPDTGISYASGFAAFQFKPSHNKPGVVIAIDKKLTLGSDDYLKDAIPISERAVKGKLPASCIKEIYFIIPISNFLNGKYIVTKEKHPSAPNDKSYWKVYVENRTGLNQYIVKDMSNEIEL